MHRVLAPSVAAVAALAGLVAPAPAAAAGKNDRLAACMWEKAPTSTAAFADNTDRSRDFTLFSKAVAPCDFSGNFDLKGLKKQLAKIRPSVIGADLKTDAEAFVCPLGPGRKPQGCRPAGE
jgi:hypothetical protein